MIKIRKLVLTVFILAMTGCATIKDIKYSDQFPEYDHFTDYYKEILGRTICTEQHHILLHLVPSEIRFKEQEEFRLSEPFSSEIPMDKLLEEFRRKSSFSRLSLSEKILLKGAKLEIKRVYFYSVPFTGFSGYRVMALVNGEKVDGKFVDISMLFAGRHYDTDGKGQLSDSVGKFCDRQDD